MAYGVSPRTAVWSILVFAASPLVGFAALFVGSLLVSRYGVIGNQREWLLSAVLLIWGCSMFVVGLGLARMLGLHLRRLPRSSFLLVSGTTFIAALTLGGIVADGRAGMALDIDQLGLIVWFPILATAAALCGAGATVTPGTATPWIVAAGVGFGLACVLALATVAQASGSSPGTLVVGGLTLVILTAVLWNIRTPA